jgi:tetratricopeptide (TPR) repeat protein
MRSSLCLVLLATAQACATPAAPKPQNAAQPAAAPAAAPAPPALIGRAEELAKAEELMDRAEAALDAHQDSRGVELMLEAADLGLPRAHHNLGVLAEQNGAFVTAQQHFQKALELDPGYDPSALQLARFMVEGWNSPIDYADAARQFEKLTHSQNPRTGAFAHMNLAVMSLYGFGRPHSLEDARAHLRAASPVVAQAGELLASLPADIARWPGNAVPEPLVDNPHVSVDARPGGYASRPDWAANDPKWRDARIEPPLRGTYVFEHVVAMGAPGDDAVNPAVSSMAYKDSFEWRYDGKEPARFAANTWHTNQLRCDFGAHLIAKSGDAWVLYDDQKIDAIDALSGETTKVEGCYVRVQVAGTRLTFVEDWPRNCSVKSCAGRGALVGQSYALTATKQSKSEIDANEERRSLEPLLAMAPAWTRIDTEQTRRKLSAELGVLRASQTVDAVGSKERVTDELRICADDQAGAAFALDTLVGAEHACALSGRAGINASGSLLLVTGPDNLVRLGDRGHMHAGMPCTLRAAPQDGKLVFTDVWPENCEFPCGAHAEPMEVAFPLSSRKPGDCKRLPRKPRPN